MSTTTTNPIDVFEQPTILPASRRAPPKPGDLIGVQWRLDTLIAQGDGATTWRATHVSSGQAVRLRVLASSAPARMRHLDRLQGLRHPAIAPVVDAGVDPEAGGFYAMLCSASESLGAEREAAGGQLKVTDLVARLRPIANALDHAHAQRIFHGDLSPEHILVAGESVELVDFGHDATPGEPTGRTAAYQAPERWRGEQVGAAADQYALAALAHEMLSGALPFDLPNHDLLRLAVLEDSPPPALPADLARSLVIQRGLSKDPTGRFDSCAAFVEALAGSKAVARRRVSGPKDSRRGVLIAGVLLAFVTGFFYPSGAPSAQKASAASSPVVDAPRAVDSAEGVKADGSETSPGVAPPALPAPVAERKSSKEAGASASRVEAASGVGPGDLLKRARELQSGALGNEEALVSALDYCERSLTVGRAMADERARCSLMAEIYFVRGTIHADLEQHEHALLDYSRAIELDLDHISARVVRGGLYFERRQYGKALADFQKANAMASPDWIRWYQQAVCERKVGQLEVAIATFERSLALAPNDQVRARLSEEIRALREEIQSSARTIQLPRAR